MWHFVERCECGGRVMLTTEDTKDSTGKPIILVTDATCELCLKTVIVQIDDLRNYIKEGLVDNENNWLSSE